MNKLTIKEATRVWLCPTDTIYGLSARADDAEAVERIRQIKGRREDMPFIILLANISQLAQFNIAVSQRQQQFLELVWPGPVTVAFTDELSFRIPDYPALQSLLQEVGPIVSTSANRHGKPPVTSVAEAQSIFGEEIDEYLDAGELAAEPSTLIKLLR